MTDAQVLGTKEVIEKLDAWMQSDDDDFPDLGETDLVGLLEGKYLPQPIAGFEETKRVEVLNRVVGMSGALLRNRVLWIALALGDELLALESTTAGVEEKSFTLARAVREFRYLESKLTKPASSLVLP